jgi:cytochrome c oxidase assembly protein subunit 15
MTALTDSAFAPQSRAAPRAVAHWLVFCAGMVWVMAIIGAVTRLTESGLSITVWEPLTGWRWPMNLEQWQAAFDLYRATPHYQQVMAGITLDEFKTIFFWEWFHRLWGRLIGFAFALPFAYFWIRKQIPAGYMPKLLGLFVLGGLQGAIGWFMVASGLVDRPAVSHYRLALHLGMAFLIFALLLWVAFDLYWGGPQKGSDAKVVKMSGHAKGTLALIAITILWGAFTAGLDAGKIHNTWPLMSGRFVPEGMWFQSPWWINPLQNVEAVQFTHRILAYLAVLGIVAMFMRARKIETAPRLRFWLYAALGLVFVQALLGILTVLTVVAIPLAALHQANGFLLVAAMVGCIYEMRRPAAR